LATMRRSSGSGGVELLNRLGRAIQYGVEYCCRGVAAERQASCDDLVQHHAEGEQVRPPVRGLAARLLRRHIRNGAHYRPGLSQAWGRGGDRLELGSWHELRETEVEELHVAILGNHHVFRLDVAVNHAVSVRRRQTVDDLQRELEHALYRQLRPVDHAAQRGTGEQLHHDEGPARVLVDCMDRGEIRVVQRREQVCFACEASRVVGVAHNDLRKHFDGYLALELRIERAINLPHAARANPRDDLVGSELCADIDGHAIFLTSPLQRAPSYPIVLARRGARVLLGEVPCRLSVERLCHGSAPDWASTRAR
jgi:hypothetical protein